MRMKTLQTENGFTLIEALVAMVVLSIGIFSLYSMQLNGISWNSKANTLTVASTWNADQVEKLIGTRYSDTTLRDNDGDGTNHDPDRNGVDDRGENFGLDDITIASADGNFATPDGRYTVLWNVAVDVPMPNLKTIRVHVLDNAQRLAKPVTFTYIKADTI